MKLLRYGPSGHEKPGLLDADGNIRDISGIVSNIDSGVLAPKRLAHLRKFAPAKLPLVRGKPRLGVPVHRHRQVHRHRPELRRPRGRVEHADPERADRLHEGHDLHPGPERPRHAAQGLGQDRLGSGTGVVIGTTRPLRQRERGAGLRGRLLRSSTTSSEREFQLERGRQWDKGKGCDTFGPIGPWLVTTDEIDRRRSVLDMWLDVNGQQMQTRQHAHHDLRRGASW